MTWQAADDRPRLVILGGGVAAVEALLAAAEFSAGRAEIILVSGDPHFRLPPLAAAAPFAVGHAAPVDLAELCARHDATFRQGLVAMVDAPRQRLVFDDGAELAYQALIVAVGATPVPGTEAGTHYEPAAPDRVAGIAADLEEGWAGSVAVVVPDAPTWPMPPFEFALYLRHAALTAGSDAAVHLCTPDPEPLRWLSEEAAQTVARTLAEAGVQLHAGRVPKVVRSGVVEFEGGGEPVHADRILALPRLVGPAMPGLPYDEHGFIEVRGDRTVPGRPMIWAAGDGTTTPVKFGALACHAADLAAAGALDAIGLPGPHVEAHPVLHARLLTPQGSVSLSSDPSQPEPEGGWTGGEKIAGRYLRPALEQLGATYLVPQAERARQTG